MPPIPQYLKKGDTVAIAGPARKVNREEILPFVSLLESWGLKVLSGKHLFAEFHQFAGEDHLRGEDLQYFLDHPEVRAIFCSRGGYGTLRILDGLRWEGFLRYPKWVVGFSDITVLHAHIQGTLGMPSIHGIMGIQVKTGAGPGETEAARSLRDCLFGKEIRIEMPRHPLSIPGSLSGELTGGNLSVLCSLSGSPTFPSTHGKILFIEDLDEYLYHLDRMMLNLKRSGQLDTIAGLLVGAFTDMRDNEIPFGKNAEQIIYDCVKDFGYPVFFGFPAGHIPLNTALKLGWPARIRDNALILPA